MHWFYLFIAIFAEVAATSALKAADGFTNFWPSVIVIMGYATSFFFLSLLLRTIPVGIAYAIWSGAGIILLAIVSAVLYNQKLDMPAILGIAFIVLGVIVLQVFSKSVVH